MSIFSKKPISKLPDYSQHPDPSLRAFVAQQPEHLFAINHQNELDQLTDVIKSATQNVMQWTRIDKIINMVRAKLPAQSNTHKSRFKFEEHALGFYTTDPKYGKRGANFLHKNTNETIKRLI